MAAIEWFTRDGDTVVIVGAGVGATPLAAAESVGPEGVVHVVEPVREILDHMRDLAQEKGVADRVELHHARVGVIDWRSERGYGAAPDAEAWGGMDLPTCDVLQVDCEGCERTLVPELSAPYPRVIILSIHPRQVEDVGLLVEDVVRRGYDVVASRADDLEDILVFTHKGGP